MRRGIANNNNKATTIKVSQKWTCDGQKMRRNFIIFIFYYYHYDFYERGLCVHAFKMAYWEISTEKIQLWLNEFELCTNTHTDFDTLNTQTEWLARTHLPSTHWQTNREQTEPTWATSNEKHTAIITLNRRIIIMAWPNANDRAASDISKWI